MNAYPITTRVKELAEAFRVRMPKDGYLRQLEKVLELLALTDTQKDDVFRLALSDQRFPTVGRLREIALPFQAANAQRAGHRITHVSFRCTKCHYVYAVPVARMQDAGEFDVIHCEGMRRIAPNAIPSREQKYEYEKCNQSYTVAYLAQLWKAQGTGQSVELV